MVVKVVFRAKEILDLAGSRIELQPLLVGRMGDALRVDTRRLNPVTDSVYAVLRRSKQVMNVFG